MNKYLSYTSRDFTSINEELVGAIPTLTNIWTNREQSDPGIVLTTLMSALGDNLSFNMDTQSLEFFGKTVTQRKNAQYVFDLVGYKMHWYESAQLEITINNISENDSITLNFNPTNNLNTQRLTSTLVSSAPSYFILNPVETPYNWNSNTIITIPPRTSHKFVAVQGTLNSVNFSSNSIDENNRYYLPVSKIDQNHIWLKDSANAYQWYLTDNINELSEMLPRFEFGVDEFDMPYIEFVPYWRTAYGGSDNSDLSFTLYYLSTLGVAGNVTANVMNYISGIKNLNENYLDGNIYDNIVITHSPNTHYTDNVLVIPGKNPESAQEAYLASRNIIGTHNTLVTLVDFERFFKRIGLISNTFALDGQRAIDLNEHISETFNKLLVDNVNNPDKVFVTKLPTSDIDIEKYYILLEKDGDFEPAAYTYTNDTSSTNDIIGDSSYDSTNWVKSKIVDAFGFLPYSCEMHMVAGDFEEFDTTTPVKSYAKSTPKVGIDSNNNHGWMDYRLLDNVVGTASDSLVNQTNLEECKLISTDITYGSVRKFPFFIDGKIYLKEPTTPDNANLVLKNVYLAIARNFQARKLTFGKKIKFSDMINVISNADDRIDYFDAGANNSCGSLFVYPTENDVTPYVKNLDGTPAQYGINIDIKYFNPLSLQHYEDILYQNNQYMYWSKTSSGHLSIAPECIIGKTTPNISNVSSMALITTDDITEIGDINYIVNIYDTPLGVSPLFEYAFVKEIHTIQESLENVVEIEIDKWQSSNKFLNVKSDIGGLPNKGVTQWYFKTVDLETLEISDDETLDTNHFIIAYRLKSTDTTNESGIKLVSGVITMQDDALGE